MSSIGTHLNTKLRTNGGSLSPYFTHVEKVQHFGELKAAICTNYADFVFSGGGRGTVSAASGTVAGPSARNDQAY